MMTEQQILFIINNREMVMSILGVYLEWYKTLIWKEKDTQKKIENSLIADRIEDVMMTVKNLTLDKNAKPVDFTGV